MKKQQGFGLSEVLIALFLGSLIVTVLMRHYLIVKRQYHVMQLEMADDEELQEVIDDLRHSIRHAGFTPCMSVLHLQTLSEQGTPLQAFVIANDGSSLQLNRMSTSFDTVLSIPGDMEVITRFYTPFHPRQVLLLADCNHAEVVRVAHIRRVGSRQIVAFKTPMLFHYEPPAYLGAWLTESYRTREGKGLFYHLHHTEEWSNAVQRLRAFVVTDSLGIVLHVVLERSNDSPVAIDTRLRTV